MKYTYLLLGIGLLATTFSARGQQTLTLRLQHRPATELFEAVERQTAYRIFCRPSDTDSLFVSLDATDRPVKEALEEALGGTSLKISLFQGRYLFILSEKEMYTLLAGNLFRQKEEAGPDDVESYAVLMDSQRGRKANSENKVYEIGNKPENAPAGRVSLEGQITHFKTGEPVAGATVLLREPWIATSTDQHGYYRLLLPPGRQELEISGVGIQNTRRQIRLNDAGQLDIVLEEESYALEEVVITSGRIENVKETQMGLEKLQMKEIKNIPTAFGESDILKVLQTLPGVKTVGEAAGGINVRGGATDQNLILFNNGTIYNPNHLFGFFSAFNPDMVKEAELYKSGIPAQYGGRISSVLDIQGREGNKEKFSGSAGIGILTSRLTLEGPLVKDKTSLLLSGRTTYSDWIMKKLPKKSGYNDGNAGFYDLAGTLAHSFSRHDNLAVHGYYSHDRFSFQGDEKYGYTNANASAKWRHIFQPKLTASLTAGYDHYDYETYTVENDVNSYRLGFDINQWYGKLDFTSYPADRHTLDFGVSGLFYQVNPGTHEPAGSESLVIPDALQKEKALESAVYAGYKWEVTSELSIYAGARYSMFNALGPRTYYRYDPSGLPAETTLVDTVQAGKGKMFKTYHGPEFRLSLRYAFTNDLSVKAGFNSMRQYIHKISNTTVVSPTDTWKLSDVNIRPQSGWQTAAGVYWNLPEMGLETSVEGYYKWIDDYLDYRSGAKLLMNHHLETDVVNTEGRAYGIECMIKKPAGRLNGWISYTYSRTKLRQNDPRIDNPVNRGEWYPAEYDKPHDVKLVGNFKFTQRYSVSVNCDYSTGRPITLPASKYYDYELGTEMVFYSDRNKVRIPDYFRVDLAFNIEPSHKLTLLTHSSFSIGVYNLTGRKNAYSVYYITEEGTIKGYQMSIFGVPIPFITYNIKF